MAFPGLFFASHLFVEILVFIFMTGIIAFSAWAEKGARPDEHYTCPIVVGLRAFFFIVATVIGLLCWDTLIKQLFFGVFGYGNLTHWIGITIVLGIIGTEFIMMAAFVAPSRKALVTFISILVTFIYIFDIYGFSDMTEFEDAILEMLLYCIAVGFIIQCITATVHGIYRLLKRGAPRDEPLWDIRAPFKRVFSRKVNIILWGLVTADFMLSFEGHGLLSWLPLNAFLGAIGGIAVALVTYKLVAWRHAGTKLLQDEWDQKHFARTDKIQRTLEDVKMPDGEVLQGFIYRSTTSPGQPDALEKAPGPAILFLHGFGGFAQDVHFEPMLAALATAGYTVFAYDYRWSGHSRKKGQKGVFQGLMKEGSRLFEHMFADALPAFEWMLSRKDIVDPARAGVAGFSMGGTIALSGSILADPRVKVVLAGCAIHDIGQNLDRKIVHGGLIAKVVGLAIWSKIRKSTGLTLQQFLQKASDLSPVTTLAGVKDTRPALSKKVLLAHCKNDEFVDFELNYVKNKELIGVPDGQCIVFDSGGHEFKHNETALLGWVSFQLRKML